MHGRAALLLVQATLDRGDGDHALAADGMLGEERTKLSERRNEVPCTQIEIRVNRKSLHMSQHRRLTAMQTYLTTRFGREKTKIAY